MKNRHLYLKVLSRISIFFILGVSCLSPYEPATTYSGGKIVISGQITPLGKESNIIEIGRTSNEKRLPFPIRSAVVMLNDDKGNHYPYQEDFEHPGKYILYGMSGVPGTTYFINVLLPDGESYQSLPEKMPVAIGKDEVFYEILDQELTDPEGTVRTIRLINIFSHAKLPVLEGSLYIKWHVEEVFRFDPTDFPDPFGNIPPSCYINQNADPQRVVVYNNIEAKIEKINNLLIASRIIDYSFYQRHYFTIYQSSLTSEAYEYWRKVNAVANQVGSIFDTPPATISGNIFRVGHPTEEVLGYFHSSNQIFARIYILPSHLPFTLARYCLYGADRPYTDYPSICLDCLSIRNSSYNKPEWF